MVCRRSPARLTVALLVCCCAHAAGLLVGPSAAAPLFAAAAASPQQRSRSGEPTMMAKKVLKMIKLALNAGKATPAPPIGPALGSAGCNIMMFCKEYNARTADKVGTVVPVEITVFEDKSFTFILKTPPCSELVKKAAGITVASGNPFGRDKKIAGSISMTQVEEIAKIKLPDLNTDKLQSAMNTVMGTCRNMGIEVKD